MNADYLILAVTGLLGSVISLVVYRVARRPHPMERRQSSSQPEVRKNIDKCVACTALVATLLTMASIVTCFIKR